MNQNNIPNTPVQSNQPQMNNQTEQFLLSNIAQIPSSSLQQTPLIIPSQQNVFKQYQYQLPQPLQQPIQQYNQMNNAQQQQYQQPYYQQQQQQQQYQQQSPFSNNYFQQPYMNNNNNNYPSFGNQPFSQPQPMNPENQIEDEIVEAVKQNANNKNKVEYDLEKGLSLDVKSLQKHFQFNKSKDQIIPVMVSVKTVEKTNSNTDESNILQSRPNLDLICVIDNSGSMQGAKIETVKQTLTQLIDMLGENDRLSLITFNSYATQLCNLRKVDAKNKESIQTIIQQIYSTGGTDITSGIKIAFDIFSNRKQANSVSSIFLLSDGQDQSADTQIRNLLATTYSNLSDQCFTIHSFGFGSDHDGPLMNRICQIKDGSFYYVEKIDQVDEFFVDALGGLFSVVAQDIQIEVQINRSNEIFNKLFENSTVERTYGPMWKVIKQNEGYSIKMNQLFSGVSKDFIFEIRIPKCDVASIQDYERNVELIKAQLTALPVDIKDSTKIMKENNLVLTLFTEDEKVAQDSEINDNVEFNYLRVKAAQAMQDAIKFADSNQYEQGQQVLTDMLKRIESSHPNNKQKLEVLKQDIAVCQQSAQPQVYQQQGKFNMLQNCNNNFQQQSYANKPNDIYQNVCQKAMVQQQQHFKMNNNC